MKCILRDLLSALKFIHSLLIIHRDVKGETERQECERQRRDEPERQRQRDRQLTMEIKDAIAQKTLRRKKGKEH